MFERYKNLFEPRNLTEQDRLEWEQAQDERMIQPLKPRTRDEVRNAIKYRNPVRWWQIQRDFSYLRREMKRLGLNPEDARWII